MSEKRFEIWKINSKKNGVKDNQENVYYSLEEFLDWLNEKDKHIGMESIMSEKRFDNIEISEKMIAFYDNGEFTALDENGLGKLLNRLHKENIYLSRIRKNQQQMILKLYERNEQLKNYFKKRAECSNFQINKLKEEIAELQEDNVDTIVELSKENEQLRKELNDCEKFRYQVFKGMEKIIREKENDGGDGV